MAVKCMEGPFVFRLNENGTGPHLLVQVKLITFPSISQVNDHRSYS